MANASSAGSLQLTALDNGYEREADAQATQMTATQNVTLNSVQRLTGAAVLQRQAASSPGETPESPPPSLQAEQMPKCGPDATDWFVRQVNIATTDPDVLAIKRNLTMANTFAGSFGITASQVAETGATLAVLGQEVSLGSRAPARNPTISSQLAEGARSAAATAATLPPGVMSPPTRISPFPSPSSGLALLMAYYLRQAALGWKALVDHRARYDFKAHSDSMNHPSGATCPDETCPPGEVGIITLCPGLNPRGQNCYESDLPGNLFYALIGRHVGWSELTLQLGSQYAELTDITPMPMHPVITWDTPQDTTAISLGYRLPLPLTRSTLCSAVPPARGGLAFRAGCDDCLDPTRSRIH